MLKGVYNFKKDPNNRWFFVYKEANDIELVSRTFDDERLLKEGVINFQNILTDKLSHQYKIQQHLNYYIVEFYDRQNLLICLSKNYRSYEICHDNLMRLLESKGQGTFE